MSADSIVDDLAERIRRGQYKPGTRLPTYRELADLYDVSPATIATIVVRLKERGLVVGVQGRGVFVAESARRSATDNPFST
jgi:DNA-binding GntR family transcriptional regulator